jgi:hypothetical protein
MWSRLRGPWGSGRAWGRPGQRWSVAAPAVEKGRDPARAPAPPDPGRHGEREERRERREEHRERRAPQGGKGGAAESRRERGEEGIFNFLPL